MPPSTVPPASGGGGTSVGTLSVNLMSSSYLASNTVCVTGANGYLGSHVVLELLRRGRTVHAAVRNPLDPKNQFLSKLPAMAGVPDDRLVVMIADLTVAGSYEAALHRCACVVHTASVVSRRIDANAAAAAPPSPQETSNGGAATGREVEPTVPSPEISAMKHFLTAAVRAGVTRIIYTSTSEALQAPEIDRTDSHRGKPYSEEEFGTVTRLSPTWRPYGYHKQMAEKVLDGHWDWEYAVMYPVTMYGPALSPSHAPAVLPALINGELSHCPRLYSDWVDVRDVAAAHVSAVDAPARLLERPWAGYTDEIATTKAKYILSRREVRSMQEAARHINAGFPQLACPEDMRSLWMLKCQSWCDRRLTAEYFDINAMEGRPFDNSKAQHKDQLAFSYAHTDFKQTLIDTVSSLLELGVVRPPRRS